MAFDVHASTVETPMLSLNIDYLSQLDWEAYFHNQLLVSNGSLIVYCFVAILFFTSVWSILKMDFQPRQRPMVVLCLAGGIFGFSGSVIIMIYYFLFDTNCIARNALSLILFQFSATCTDLVLLMRACVVNEQRKILVYVGGTLCATKYIPFIFVLTNLRSNLSEVLHVCEYVNLPTELNYVMGIDLVANFFFCILFILAIRKHINMIKTEIAPTLFQTDISQRIKSYYRIVKKSIHFFIISAVTMFIVILMTLLTNNNVTNTILPYYLGMALASRFLTSAVVSFRSKGASMSTSQSFALDTNPTFDQAEGFSSELASVVVSDADDLDTITIASKSHERDVNP